MRVCLSHLAFGELREDAVLSSEGIEVALFYNATRFNDVDAVGVADGAEAVCNDDAGDVELVEAGGDDLLGAIV